ncbi:hypothetical protein Bca52824_035847 [Brassica carinata]|uniref:DUF4283 domain-containing protein n=1 Tax=Brassica carinata TaxID=52824 RepID=A0A8X7S3L1_BRACI|nr:hypothetical protein Bca52824_035847 [Brassica carinata]
MSQGQLVNNGGGLKNGDGNRKRLKISVAHFDNSDLIKSYSRTLIGRCMNPDEQKVSSLLIMLPKIWHLEEKVVGVDLGMGKFQFHFEKEEDIFNVLEMQPYHFDYWMLALGRWQPRMPKNFPSEIPFWIQVVGVPTEFWSSDTFQSIGDAIGETTDVDLDAGKIRVVIDGNKELCFETTVDFKGGEFYEGEEVPVTLKFEKLFGYCLTCFSLLHDVDHCPLNPKRQEKKRESREETVGKGEDRARSYKGVVIKSEVGYQQKDKEYRGYQGKGKGKMFEEPEVKWNRIPERRSNKSATHRRNNRFEDEGPRNRNTRWERSRTQAQEDREQNHRVLRRERSPRQHTREKPEEDREIKAMENDKQCLQQVAGTKVLALVHSHPVENLENVRESENGLDLVSETLEEDSRVLEVEGMELEEDQKRVEREEDSSLMEDGFENLTDGDGKDEIQEENREVVAECEQGGTELKQGEEDAEKKAGARKQLFLAAAGGTSTKKFVNVLLSPRKRATGKQVARKGGSSKQQKDKGPSNPKPNLNR